MSSYEKTHIIRPADKPASRGELLRWAGWFFLANSLIALLIALRYFTATAIPADDYSMTFSALAFIGHFSALGFIGAALLLLPIVFFPQRMFIFAVGIILALIFIFGVSLDTLAFNQYRLHLDGLWLSPLFDSVTEMLVSFSIFNWSMLGLFVLGSIGFQLWLSRRIWSFVLATPHRIYGYLTGTILFAIFSAQNVLYAWADANAYSSITQQNSLLPAYKPLTARHWFMQRGWAKAKKHAPDTPPKNATDAFLDF
jgi:uncharacterized protein